VRDIVVFKSGQFWWSTRLGPSGQTEYDFRYPETEQTLQQKQETPRSPGPNITTSDDPQYNVASGTAEETNYDVSEDSDNNIAAVGSAGPGLYQSTPNYQVITAKYYIPSTSGDFQGSRTSSSLGNSFLSKTTSSTGSFDSYGSSPMSGVPNKEYDASGEITRGMRSFTFSRQPTITEVALATAPTSAQCGFQNKLTVKYADLLSYAKAMAVQSARKSIRSAAHHYVIQSANTTS
jgi:hypothetical protein